MRSIVAGASGPTSGWSGGHAGSLCNDRLSVDGGARGVSLLEPAANEISQQSDADEDHHARKR